MPAKKEKLNDRWFRFIGLPLLIFLSHVIFYSDGEVGSVDEGFTAWQVYLISLIEALLIWEPCRMVITYFRNRFPGLHQSPKRILWQLITCTVVTVLIRFATMAFYDVTLFWGYNFPVAGYVHSIAVALLFMIILGGVYECLYYFKKWKQLFHETEALKRENLQTQLDSLKTQINPHFLFNNLSSLVSLIMEDQHKAVTFVNELSSVYRYLLQANTKDLVTLEVELQFIDHYFHLLKTRFEEGVELQLRIEDKYKTYAIPPLTLQLLLENAVKHNAVLPQKPLIIQMFTDEVGNLIVNNNLQKKTRYEPTSQMGLKNIITKYHLLAGKEVQVTETETEFRVVVPLIKQEFYENTDSRR